MPNIALPSVLGGMAPTTPLQTSPVARGSETHVNDTPKDDPAAAFNRVMERTSNRLERKATHDAKRPADSQPTQPSPRTDESVRADPVASTQENVAEEDTAEPTTATGDLFAAELSQALAVTARAETPTDLTAAVAVTTVRTGEAAQATALVVPDTGEATSVSSGTQRATAIQASELAGSQGPVALDGENLPTRATPRPPRAMDTRDASVSKATGDFVSAGHALHDRSAATAEGVAVVTAFEQHTASIARPEPAPAAATLPLSLSAALAAGTPTTWTGNAPMAPLYSMAHAHIATPLSAPGFSEDFSQRVVMLAGQRVQSAEIALTPSDLGPISVTMEMRGQEASLIFGATQLATRSAIEDALPRLREMFQAHGLQLVDAHVGSQVGHQARRDASQDPTPRSTRDNSGDQVTGATGIDAEALSAQRQSAVRVNRLVDIRV